MFKYLLLFFLLNLNVLYSENLFQGTIIGTDVQKNDTKINLIRLDNKNIVNPVQKKKDFLIDIKGESSIDNEDNINFKNKSKVSSDPFADMNYDLGEKNKNKNSSTIKQSPKKKKNYRIIYYVLGGLGVLLILL